MSAASALVLTAILNGGGTVWRSGDIARDVQGFVVGGVVPSLVYDRSDKDASEVVKDVQLWIDMQPYSVCYGSWKDEETGLLHFDVVDFVKDREAAIKLGRERGELAIWDFGASEEIRL